MDYKKPQNKEREKEEKQTKKRQSRSRSRSQEKMKKKSRSPSSSSQSPEAQSKTIKTTNKEDNKQSIQQRIQKKEKPEEIKQIKESELIPSLKEDLGFLNQEFNKRLKEQKQKDIDNEQDAKKKRTLELFNPASGRAGGIYVPPFKLRQLQEQLLSQKDQNDEEHQRLMWDLLRKSINGIVNKINVSNIQNVIIELLNENILRGKGLFARAVIKAQMSSPNFTHVYAALIAIVNTKLPDIVNLIIRRVFLQFQRSFKRNNKLVCQAALKMIAHLINQKVLTDYIGLQLLLFFLENPTEDTIELACEFMIECGQVLSELTPVGVNAIFERFKGILHEGECERRVQYSIENLFAVRKTRFKDHPGIIQELDLVDEPDQITHNFDLLDEFDAEENLNIFRFDPFYEKTEKEWEQIKFEILGEENILILKEIPLVNQPQDEQDEENDQMKIKNLTEEDRANLRRTLYLTIMSSVDFEECCHKILKMNLGVGHENEVCNMIQECCQNERTYMKFYGLLAQRFCELSELYRDNFMKCFIDLYATIHRYETAKIRNSAKYYAHLFYTDSIDWRVFACITLTQETTTASSRIFIKNLILEICENTGLEDLQKRFSKEEHLEFFNGLFPKDHPKNTRFAINFYISIGLGALTEQLNEHLKQQTLEFQKQQAEQLAKQQLDLEENQGKSSSSEEEESSSSSSSSSEDEDESQSSKSSDIESEQEKKKKKKKK